MDPILVAEAMNDELIRVYRMPRPQSRYCFGSGVPQECVNLDWFRTPPDPLSGRPPTQDDIIEWVRQKRYYEPGLLILGETWAALA